jgi:uncharacterized protein YgbK (DUF1537 family)
MTRPLRLLTFTAAVFAQRAGLARVAAAPVTPADTAMAAPSAAHRPMVLVSGSVTPLTFTQLEQVKDKLRTI